MPISHRLGSVTPLSVVPREPDGRVADITGMALQLRVSAGGACIILPGAPNDGIFTVDLSELTLEPGTYRVAVWLSDDTGWRFIREFMLEIQGGC